MLASRLRSLTSDGMSAPAGNPSSSKPLVLVLVIAVSFA
jgi:hypothetical protein